ncbi:MAG: glycosyltransferase family 39 protein [Microcystis sp. M015S2]|uniref:glycosyltransferase family 39 protein n=1 Tax=unclassified Microcystis TaxID=2643300 RepID=UPI00258F1140|nr:MULTISPECIES: glycosyltransferase family 39 protein [unclassified Microcystis]MCA2711193.1 glycosyltransferase family 39 protein [Microcystis sp. M025S2]MCA2743275.1 glycosyltransferase family 39 protein [Microcystis sp. M015S2]MCA2760634.1 glycosyltransferase family 39 protein [Microcystis sp. M145S2]
MMDQRKYLPDRLAANFGQFLIIAILLIGIGLRFFNLEQKVYSADEVRRIMRFSGYTIQDVREQAFNGEIIGRKDLQYFQHPHSERSLSDALRSLMGNPEHPPLYNLSARFWMQLIPIEHSARTFSIFLSILAMLCLYWLCLELFDSSLTAWIASALFAVSPFRILSAQNATQYSCWTVTILLSGIALLRAIRKNTLKSWLWYSLSLALTFYTHLFSAPVAIAQALYVILLERLKITRTVVSYVLAAVGSLVLFSPWLFVIFTNLDKIDRNTQYYRQFKTNIIQISQTLFRNIGHLFVNFYHRKGRLESAFHLLILLLLVYSLYYLIRYASPKVSLFLITLIVVPTLFQIVPDLLKPSLRSLQARYYMPVFLAVRMAISYLIASYIGSKSPKNWRHYLGQQILLILLLLGIVSGVFLGLNPDAALDDQRGTANGANLEIATVLNSMTKPIVISDSTPSFFLGLSYLVNDQVKFQLFQDGDVESWRQKLNLKELAQNYSNIVVAHPEEDFVNFLNEQYPIRTKKLAGALIEIKLQ